jgi:hypothetical protein
MVIMSPEQLFFVYAMDRRQIGLTGYEVERFPHLTCFTPFLKDRDGLIAFASLPAEHAARQIKEQIEYFKLVGIPFRWRVFDLDGAGILPWQLVQNGLMLGSTSVLMVHRFERRYTVPKIPVGMRLVQVSQPRALRDALAVYSAAFGRSHTHLYNGFREQIAKFPDTLSVYCLYEGERPIGAAWTEFPRGSQFPELHPEALIATKNTSTLSELLTLHRLSEVHSRLYDRAMVVVHKNRLAAAHAAGFETVSNRVTLHWTPSTQPTQAKAENNEYVAV